ncbi:hypothetical protein AK812_SmicGene40434 [Symbiodinium microadriaticum]|uniref:Uncharacterized protein n=1 Tax=Symbiodinium microadriaticum TaxID=2951 RepID=A0A1Q9C8R2_SYMMI|nr:hypothetical protein AK812_SmicGene40434 [Symbiodinium microadriaticum]CAE7366342.1 unnamed protein product [Symbiodinium sp. KB8]CAE7394329.1 unnamed protein product [Symbiodinium microadriaticum]
MLSGFGDDPFAAEPLTGSGGVPDGAKPPASNAPSKRKREPGARGVKQAEAGKTCFVKSCEDDKLVGKKWCCRHNRLYDNLWTQAKKSNETAAVQQAVSTPEGADHALSDFERDNPPHAKYARKSVIQWGQFKRVHVVSQTTRSRNGCKPYEWKQWLKRCEQKMGWAAADAKKLWNHYSTAQEIDKDHEGLNGAIRLWIPTIEATHNDTDRSRTFAFEEGGAQERDMDEDHRQVLMDHCLHSGKGTNQADNNFLQGRAVNGPETDNSEVPELQTPKKNKELNDPASKDNPSPEDEKKRKRLEKLARGPAFEAHKATMVHKLKEKMKGLDNLMATVGEKIREAHAEMANDRQDAVKLSYLKAMEAGTALLEVWKTEVELPACEGKPEELKDLPDVVARAQTAFCDKCELLKDLVQPVNSKATCFTRAALGWFHSISEKTTCIFLLERIATEMKDHAAVIDQFARGLQKVATDAKNFQSQQKRKAQQDEAKKKREEEKKAASEATALAKAAAKKVKSGSKGRRPMWPWSANAIRSRERPFDLSRGACARKEQLHTWARIQLQTDRS